MNIQLTIEDVICTGCGTCIDSCPTDVLRQREPDRKAYVAFLDDCQSCFLCVWDCPVDAISLTQDPIPWEALLADPVLNGQAGGAAMSIPSAT